MLYIINTCAFVIFSIHMKCSVSVVARIRRSFGSICAADYKSTYLTLYILYMQNITMYYILFFIHMKRSISVVAARIRPARIHSLTDSEADRTDPPSLSLRLSRFIFSLSLTHTHSHTLGRIPKQTAHQHDQYHK